jgi:hypothetical protein
MYGTGIPTGLMVDRKGPRTGAVFGCVVIAVGYFAIYQGGSRRTHSKHFNGG